MECIYFFSNFNFNLLANNKTYYINKNSYCKLSNVEKNEKIIIKNLSGAIELLPQSLKSCNFYNVWELNNKFFIELICTNFSNLKQKILTKNAEVFLYDTSVRIIYKEICISKNFIYSYPSYVIEINDNIFFFNDKNLLIFNINKNSFSYLLTTKFNKNEEKIELLCKFNKNFNYFLYFCFNTKNETVTIKRLTNKATATPEIMLEFLIFNLLKHDFEHVNNYLSKNINAKQLHEYVCMYNDMVLLDNSFYLVGENKITPISFTIQNNIVIDID